MDSRDVVHVIAHGVYHVGLSLIGDRGEGFEFRYGAEGNHEVLMSFVARVGNEFAVAIVAHDVLTAEFTSNEGDNVVLSIGAFGVGAEDTYLDTALGNHADVGVFVGEFLVLLYGEGDEFFFHISGYCASRV